MLMLKQKKKNDLYKVLIELGYYFGENITLKKKYSNSYLLFVRLNRIIINIFTSFYNFNFLSTFLKHLITKNSKIFFISNNRLFARMLFFFTKTINQYCFVGSWVPGLLTNFELILKKSFLKITKPFINELKYKKDFGVPLTWINQSKKVKIELIDILFLIGSSKAHSDAQIIDESLKWNFPLIGYLSTSFKLYRSPYFLLTNINNFFNIYFLLILLIKFYLTIKKRFRSKNKKKPAIKKYFLHKKIS